VFTARYGLIAYIKQTTFRSLKVNFAEPQTRVPTVASGRVKARGRSKVKAGWSAVLWQTRPEPQAPCRLRSPERNTLA
jgi:hypothetical protein